MPVKLIKYSASLPKVCYNRRRRLCLCIGELLEKNNSRIVILVCFQVERTQCVIFIIISRSAEHDRVCCNQGGPRSVTVFVTIKAVCEARRRLLFKKV